MQPILLQSALLSGQESTSRCRRLHRLHSALPFSRCAIALGNHLNELLGSRRFKPSRIVLSDNSSRVFVFANSPKTPSAARNAHNLIGEKEELCLTDRFDISRQNACADNQD